MVLKQTLFYYIIIIIIIQRIEKLLKLHLWINICKLSYLIVNENYIALL